MSAVIFFAADAAAFHHGRHKAHAGVDRTAAYADIVIDASTGRILHATDPDGLRHPASLTKMMTLYLTFDAIETGRLRLDQYLSVSTNAAEQSPSKLGLRPGQRIKVEDAILGVVTESANDAAMVLAEGIGGSESHFGQMMTEKAHALGMSNSNFHNPNGLPDPVQVTTARDMACLGHALIHHFAQFYAYFSTASFTYAGIKHANHNHLMERYAGMDGIKTGYIRASGFNLVASAQHGDTRLIAVVFGGHSATARDNQMAILLDDGFARAAEEKRAPRMASATNRPNYPEGDGAEAGEDEEEYVSLTGKALMPPQKPLAPPPAAPSAAVAPIVLSAAGTMGRVGAAPAETPWGIQIGAFNDPSLGHQALALVVQSMPDVLKSGQQEIQEVAAGGITMYRARIAGLDEKTARSVCAYLVRHGQNCVPVAPQLTVAN